jgi:hypothetical protein
MASAALTGFAALVPSGAAATTCPVCGPNLILNPGAERGAGTTADSVVAVPGWTRSKGSFTSASYAWGGGDLSATTPGPTSRGKNYFYGGPDPSNGGSVAEGTQTISLSRGASAIKKGNVTAILSGWLGGYSGQGDDAKLSVSFLGTSGKVLATTTIGPVTAAQRKNTSELLERSAKTTVPAGSTSAEFTLVMTRASGSDNDGMADDLSLVLSVPGASG